MVLTLRIVTDCACVKPAILQPLILLILAPLFSPALAATLSAKTL